MGGALKNSVFRFAVIAVIGLFFIILFLGPNIALAESISIIGQDVSWPPDNNTLTADNGPYLIENTLTVDANRTIVFEAGVVIKMDSGAQLFVRGVLDINGTEDNPVVITSYRDDSYAGDTNNDGLSSGSVSDWNRIYVYNNASLLVDNAIFRYGVSSASQGMIQLGDGANVEIENSIIEYSGNGIQMAGSISKPSQLTVSNSVFRYNTLRGLNIAGASSLSFSSNTLTENERAMRVHDIVSVNDFSFSGNSFVDNITVGFEFNGVNDSPLDLRGSWWGSSLGPSHIEWNLGPDPSYSDNPNGDGDVVRSDSGDVLFDSWSASELGNTAPVLAFVSDEGYITDGVEPNISFVNQDVPVFKVSFSDADADDAHYVRLIVGDNTYSMATTASSTFSFTPDSSMFSKATYEYHFEASDGADVARLPESGELEFEVRNVPVILVPGISGSELKRGDELLWSDIIRMVTSFSDDFMDQLSLNEDGTSLYQDVVVDDVIRKKELISILPDSWGFDYFYSLIQNFTDAGYEENTDLFVFPYDWRLGIETSSQSLKQKIDLVLSQTNSQKVDIVSHSMGGLLTKQYVLDNSSSTINKIAFVGTPHLGSPKGTKTLLFGDNLGVEFIISFLNPSEIKKIALNMLSIYQLLPSNQYISLIGKYFYDLTIPKSYTYEEVNDYLVNQGLNSSHVQSAEEFHSDSMDNFDLTGIDAYNIIGCDTATLGKILIRNKELVETEYGIEFVAGDGTVPILSASYINASSTNVYYAKGIEHATMPSEQNIKQLITQIITENIDISGFTNITQDVSECVFNGQIVEVHKSVNLHVYDSNENHVGPDENGDIELNIPNAVYEQIEDSKFIFVPDVEEVIYDAKLDATEQGDFSLRVSKVENSEITETVYYSEVKVNDLTQATVVLSDNVSSTVLQVDENNSGSFETVSASSVLNQEEAQDTTKPTTEIFTTGGTTTAKFTLSSDDDNSGILETEYSIDNAQTWNNYSDSVIINSIGETTVLYRSKDRAGNLEDAKSETIQVSPAAVIITPMINAPSNQQGNNQNNTPSIDARSQNASVDGEFVENDDFNNRFSDVNVPSDGKFINENINRNTIDNPQVLGAEIERAKSDQYSDKDILKSLKDADVNMLLDYLGIKRDIEKERNVVQKYGPDFLLSQAAINFVSYGTKSTAFLGEGERAGIIYSFMQAFNRVPETEDDWNDIIRIATGQIPVQRSIIAEQYAISVIEDLYLPPEALYSERRMVMIAYGLRPENRDLEKEKNGLKSFVEDYGRVPNSTLDWNILRSISYK